jgi:hypothetical protein
MKSFIHAVANVTWQQNRMRQLQYVPDHPLRCHAKRTSYSHVENRIQRHSPKSKHKQSFSGGALNSVAIRLPLASLDVCVWMKRKRVSWMLLSLQVSRRDLCSVVGPRMRLRERQKAGALSLRYCNAGPREVAHENGQRHRQLSLSRWR